MTKSEVRVVTLSRLQLKETHRLLDIGCGTGSVTIEAALQCVKGQVIAFDKNPEALELTQKNAVHFSVENVTILQGEAPEDLPEQQFDRIFMGGGSRKSDEIIAYARKHLKATGIIAANTILLDSTYRILQALEKQGFEKVECTCVNVARGQKTGGGWMMKAMNPIYIISAMVPGEES